MSNAIQVRDATDGDAAAIAPLFLQAGEGLYEFLLDGVLPETAPTHILRHMVEAGDGPLGWPNCRVAVKDGAVVGMVNAFPVEQLDDLAQVLDMIPADRTNHIAPLTQNRAPGSMVLYAMAVTPTQRGAGIGCKLVAEALGMAGAERRQTLALQVWSTNLRAIKLYEDFGFERSGHVDLPYHPRLSARRSLLMARDVQREG